MLTHFRKKTCLLAAVLLGSVGFASSAAANQAPVFNNAGISFVHLELLGGKATGFGADFEVMVNDRFFFAGDMFNVSGSNSNTGRGGVRDIDYTLLHGNVGYQLFRGPKAVGYFTGGVSYADYKVSRSGFMGGSSEYDDIGYNVQLGIRSAVSSHVELDANVRHVSLSGDKDYVATVGARINVVPNFSIGASYSFIDTDMEYFTISLRYRF